jgi:hypothetical protein
MKAIASKIAVIITLTAGVIGMSAALKTLLIDTEARASSPDAIKQHQQEVMNRCLQVSGLRNPQPGSIVTFGDDVGYDALMVRGNYPQPHMNNQMGQSLCLFNRRTRQAYSSDAGQPNRYTSRRSGFQFDYPAGFVVESKSSSGKGDDRSLEWVDLWTQRDYDGIKSNVTPTELPPNVSIAVQKNPQRLGLLDWVWRRRSSQFVSPARFTSLTVAGQTAIAFQSTGLYDYENVVLAMPTSSDVMVIRLAKDGLPERNATYRPVFQQVISSLQFSAR